MVLVHSVIAIPFQSGVGRVADLIGPTDTTGVFAAVLIVAAVGELLVGNTLRDEMLLTGAATVEPDVVADN